MPMSGDRQTAVARTGDAVGRHERLISSNRRRQHAQEAHRRSGRSSVSGLTLAQVRGVTQVGALLISSVSGRTPSAARTGLDHEPITAGRRHAPGRRRRLLKGQRQAAPILRPRDLDRAQRGQVWGHPLHVEEPGTAVGPEVLHQPDQGDLGGVGHPVEHRLPGEQPPDRRPRRARRPGRRPARSRCCAPTPARAAGGTPPGSPALIQRPSVAAVGAAVDHARRRRGRPSSAAGGRTGGATG